MTVIITYDIPDDRICRRVAGYLEGTGIRVQESVFECILPCLKFVISRQ